MAGEKTVGKISEIQGTGNVLIVRSTGEKVFAKPGDLVFEGDSIVNGESSVVLIFFDNNQTTGFVTVGFLMKRRLIQLAQLIRV